MTEIVISIKPTPTQIHHGYQRSAATTALAVVQPQQVRPDSRTQSPSSKNIFFPPIDRVPFELPPPRRLAEASYQAQVPRITYAATFDTPPTQPQPLTRQRAASAAQVYTRQLNMMVYKPGMLVDFYA